MRTTWISIPVVTLCRFLALEESCLTILRLDLLFYKIENNNNSRPLIPVIRIQRRRHAKHSGLGSACTKQEHIGIITVIIVMMKILIPHCLLPSPIHSYCV